METIIGVLTILLAVFAAAVSLLVFFSLVARHRGNLPKKGGSIALFTLTVLALIAWGTVAVFGVWTNHTLGVQNIKQGLDLQGGVTILYEADKAAPTAEEMESVLGIIRTRLDNMGNTEADAAVENTNRIRVDMPGITDAAKAISEIGQTAQLTFKDPDGNVVCDGTMISRAQGTAQTGQSGKAEYVVALEFNSDGAAAFAAATSKWIGSPIYIYLDEDVISAPTVQNAINDGNAVITGNFNAQSAADLAALIRAGALPFKLNAISSSDVGATLGEKSLSMSLWAGLLGGVMVLLFMLFVYRFAGLAADIALLFYLFIELMILSAFGVTLTLPGIAGVVLSVGMAVDANVIIFERLKEELRLGRSIRYAIDIAHSKAFSAILDCNVTTLIAAAVLFWLGTGTIKGFAITLGIGIIVSMFSALVITRGVLKCIAGLGVIKPSSYGVRGAKEIEETAKGGERA